MTNGILTYKKVKLKIIFCVRVDDVLYIKPRALIIYFIRLKPI